MYEQKTIRNFNKPKMAYVTNISYTNNVIATDLMVLKTYFLPTG